VESCSGGGGVGREEGWNEERRIGKGERRGDEKTGGNGGWKASFLGDDEGSYS
jgi:hypothetical protein